MKPNIFRSKGIKNRLKGQGIFTAFCSRNSTLGMQIFTALSIAGTGGRSDTVGYQEPTKKACRKPSCFQVAATQLAAPPRLGKRKIFCPVK